MEKVTLVLLVKPCSFQSVGVAFEGGTALTQNGVDDEGGVTIFNIFSFWKTENEPQIFPL